MTSLSSPLVTHKILGLARARDDIMDRWVKLMDSKEKELAIPYLNQFLVWGRCRQHVPKPLAHAQDALLLEIYAEEQKEAVRE